MVVISWNIFCDGNKEAKRMTLQQQAYDRIEKMSDDNIRLMIEIMDRFVSANENKQNHSIEDFLKTAGKMEIDEKAVLDLRAGSMI